ncbi:hypothetical protein [Streptomyces iconiensis]|uniref:Cytochrome P450 n=1 Tax=Streptomyces iconiensis TaxID=1384038 RepID=A0ABT6ZS02_9ACTN|nr:hypothetical protein [Streptomyces iconiensis]MDJ1131841.1 hypothetical protein [Streptomyces iconiensis]
MRGAAAKAAASTPDRCEPSAYDDRGLVVRTLAGALGLRQPEAVVSAVTTIARAYFGGSDAHADAAVNWLMGQLLVADTQERAPGVGESRVREFAVSEPAARACGAPASGIRAPGVRGPGPGELEVAAGRICLLVQACDATATLLAHARNALPGCGGDFAALLDRTLRYDPPVRFLRRIAVRATRVEGTDIAEGDYVHLDIVAANADGDPVVDSDAFAAVSTAPEHSHLSFSAGPHRCPAAAHALALAEGVLSGHSVRAAHLIEERR